MMFRLYCDESYDGSPPGNARRGKKDPAFEPRTFVVAGLIADQRIWERIERGWRTVNQNYGVPRYHASHLNCRTHEYNGWDDTRKLSYSVELLKVLTDQGTRLGAFTCGVLADKYREIISEEGRRKIGSPYLMCFKTCLCRVADALAKNPRTPNDQIAVTIDQNRYEKEVLAAFYELKEEEYFPYRHLLATCTSADSSKVVALQPADLIAYEYFKRLNTARDNGTSKMRQVLSILRQNIGYDGGRYFSEAILRKLKPGIEAAVCRPNGLIILPSKHESKEGEPTFRPHMKR